MSDADKKTHDKCRHNFSMVNVDYFGHEDIEYEIRVWKCSRCGKKKQEREDY